MKKATTQEEAVLNAVKRIKKSKFKATAIKVECEANIQHNGDYTSMHDYILGKLTAYGLAEEGVYESRHSDYNLAEDYHPINALIYSKVYEDGSVDTEWTFTLSLEDERTVLLLPMMLDLFKEACQEYSESYDEFDVSGAGMHIALINSDDCSYPYDIQDEQIKYYNNFSKNMNALMPALFLLASSNEVSRDMGYRKPGVSRRGDRGYDKYWSIWYNGAIEYRVFETCHDNPTAIFDYICVIANTLKYWSNHSHKIGKRVGKETVSFGNNRNYDLKRLYNSEDTLTLLNNGLRLLKPDYTTIKSIKQQRCFSVNKRAFNGMRKKFEQQAKIAYKDYEYRYEWSLKRRMSDAEYTVYNRQAECGSASDPITPERVQELIQERLQRSNMPVLQEEQVYVNEATERSLRYATNNDYELQIA